MKLLFVIDRGHAVDDPNINLIHQLTPELEKSGCAVSFLGHTEKRAEAEANCFYFGADEAVRRLYFSLGKKSKLKRLAALLCHPWLSFLGFFKAFHIDWIAGAYRRKLERTVAEIQPDAVIAVTAPFYTAKAVAAAQLPCRKLLCMFDPYGAHYLMGGAIADHQERRCIRKMDATFVPELLAQNYKQKNVQPLAFPGVVQVRCTAEQRELYQKQKINLAFVGSLYADIRNPEAMFRLLQGLDDERMHLTVVGGLYGTYTPAFHEEFDAYLKQHVTFVPKVEKAVALCYMMQADVLVNIGNKIPNQLPSKIFEYFSTGRPILNLKQLSVCPSEFYMERYPLSCTLDATKTLCEDAIRTARMFIEKNSGRKLPFDAVKMLYPENTPEAVAAKIVAAVKSPREN